jgi:histidinol-phosphate aminotransferase
VGAADADYACDVDALLAAVTPRTRVVFLANPNNPTGTFLPREEIARLHAGLPGTVLFVLDQAYAEYLAPEDDDGGLALAAAHENVLVTRTFSKIHGLAGERIGWATGAPELVGELNRIRGPFNVASHGQAAALAALADADWVERCRKENATGRARFVEALAALGNHGIRTVPSEGNFVLVLFEGALTAETAMEAIADAGYAVRHLPGQGLPHALRITIGLADEMDAIVRAIAQAAEQAA